MNNANDLFSNALDLACKVNGTMHPLEELSESYSSPVTARLSDDDICSVEAIASLVGKSKSRIISLFVSDALKVFVDGLSEEGKQRFLGLKRQKLNELSYKVLESTMSFEK